MQLTNSSSKLIFLRRTQFFITVGLIVFFIFSILFSLANGQADISFTDIWQVLLYKTTNGFVGSIDHVNQSVINIIWFVRTPRVLSAVFIGCGLAISGTVMQAVVQNPMVEEASDFAQVILNPTLPENQKNYEKWLELAQVVSDVLYEMRMQADIIFAADKEKE